MSTYVYLEEDTWMAIAKDPGQQLRNFLNQVWGGMIDPDDGGRNFYLYQGSGDFVAATYMRRGSLDAGDTFAEMLSQQSGLEVFLLKRYEADLAMEFGDALLKFVDGEEEDEEMGDHTDLARKFGFELLRYEDYAFNEPDGQMVLVSGHSEGEIRSVLGSVVPYYDAMEYQISATGEKQLIQSPDYPGRLSALGPVLSESLPAASIVAIAYNRSPAGFRIEHFLAGELKTSYPWLSVFPASRIYPEAAASFNSESDPRRIMENVGLSDLLPPEISNSENPPL